MVSQVVIKIKYLALLIIILATLLATSCSRNYPEPVALSEWKITEQVVIEGELSQSGKFTALLLSDNSLELWSNSAKAKVALWQPNQLELDTYKLNLADSAEHILTASHKKIQTWHTESDEPLGTLDLTAHLGDAKITQIHFWQPPHRFFVGTSAGDVIFADTQSNTYRVHRSHSGEVVKLSLTANGLTLYSAGNDGRAVKWDVTNYNPDTFIDLPYRITSLAVGADGVVFISDALKDHILWQSEQDQIIGRFTHNKRFKWFREAIFLSNQNSLITSSPKTELTLWSLESFEVTSLWQAKSLGFGSAIESMVIVKPTVLRTLTSDGVLQDWDLTSLLD